MKRATLVIISVIALALIGGGLWAYRATTAGRTLSNQTNQATLDTAWRGHGLAEPFKLTTSHAVPASGGRPGQWIYQYSAATSIATAYAAAQTQLTGGGYQTIAAYPDQVPHDGTAKIFRESITDNISVAIKLEAPTPSIGPTTAIVTVTPLGQ
jgi:hypothetical protein